MREIVFDTETTGIDPQKGDRVVEIGAVELLDLIPTGRTFHAYINPERAMPDDAMRIHGLTDAFLADKPVFADASVVDAFLDFVGSDVLVAHNAEFDRRFLNAELKRLGREVFPQERFVDTLMLARKAYPGGANSLDALCRRFGVDLTARTKHGALLDSFLLAEVYLQLSGGRERRLAIFDSERDVEIAAETSVSIMVARQRRPQPLRMLSTVEERRAHQAFVKGLQGTPRWAKWLSVNSIVADQ